MSSPFCSDRKRATTLNAASFEHLTPTRIIFGSSSVDRAGDLAGQLGSHALLVCGQRAMRAYGVLDRVSMRLKAEGLMVTVYDGVSSDPRSDEVDEVVGISRERSCDVLVGLGGGSALDAAKAASVAMDCESVSEIVGKTLAPADSSLPVLAIPTTAGSGAEVTKGAIITDVERSFKSGIRGEDVFPRIAIIDPDLTATMPPEVAAETAFDALTHAIEPYVARKANPLSEVMSETATRLLGRQLPHVASGELDPEQRAALSFAALLGGLTVATASTCLPHRLQQAMGAVPNLNLSHGRGLAAVYRAWLEHAYPYAFTKFDHLGKLLGDEDIHTAIERIQTELDLTARLGDLDFGEAEIDSCMNGISGNVDNDPIDEIEPSLMRAIYDASL